MLVWIYTYQRESHVAAHNGHCQKDQELCFHDQLSLNAGRKYSIAACSKGSILQYFRPSLSYHLSFRSLFCLLATTPLKTGFTVPVIFSFSRQVPFIHSKHHVPGELSLSGKHTVTENEISGKPYSQKSGLKNHTNERIFQVMTRLWTGNENSCKWGNFPGNDQFMTPSVRHIIILPKLQEIRKMLVGWCRIVHGTILLHYLFFCCLMGFQPTFLHQKGTRSGTQTNVSAICVFH